MWAGLTTKFDSLLAARFFMGVGGGPADAVAPDVVGEVFFVHERGRVMVCRRTKIVPNIKALLTSFRLFTPSSSPWVLLLDR
jgi:MFS family permease